MTGDYPSIRFEIVELVPESVARECCVMPFAEDGNLIDMYCANVDSKPRGILLEDQLSFVLGRKIRLMPIPSDDVDGLINFYYRAAIIDGCEVRFRFQCPQAWEFLELTDRKGVRHCSTCAKNVYWCDSAEQIEAHASERRCIAFEAASGFNLLGDLAIDSGGN